MGRASTVGVAPDYTRELCVPFLASLVYDRGDLLVPRLVLSSLLNNPSEARRL